jgi:hypothetical protein
MRAYKKICFSIYKSMCDRSPAFRFFPGLLLMGRFLCWSSVVAMIVGLSMGDSFANVQYRPRSIAELERVMSMERMDMVYVPGSEVAWANYEALRRDYPFLDGKSNSIVDQWIKDNFSYVTKNQLQLNGWRNTEIPADLSRVRSGYRQANYEDRHKEFQGRGVVFEVRDFEGNVVDILDSKGNGVSDTKLQENRSLIQKVRQGTMTLEQYQSKKLTNGLMFFGDAAHEAIIMEVTQAIFDYLNIEKDSRMPEPEANIRVGRHSDLQTIESYFVLKMPFNVVFGSDPRLNAPAAIHGRQSHLGRIWMGKVFHPAVNIKQTDFSFALVDGESVVVRHPNLAPIMDGIDELKREKDGYDPATIIENKYAKDKSAIQKIIDKAEIPVRELIGSRKARPFTKITGPEEALLFAAELVAADPGRFARGAEAIYYAQNRDMRAVTGSPIVQAMIRRILGLAETVVDPDEVSRARWWGVKLIPSLVDAHERAQALHSEIIKMRSGYPHAAGYAETFADAAWMFEPDEIRPYLDEIMRSNPEAFVKSLTRKLRQLQIASDSRSLQVAELYWRALAHEATASSAKVMQSYFTDSTRSMIYSGRRAQLCNALWSGK